MLPGERVGHMGGGEPAAAGLPNAVTQHVEALCTVGVGADDDRDAMATGGGAVDIVQIESGRVGV